MRVKLVKEPLGGKKIVLEDGEPLDNVYVKSWEQIEDSDVFKVTVETVCIIDKKGRNW